MKKEYTFISFKSNYTEDKENLSHPCHVQTRWQFSNENKLQIIYLIEYFLWKVLNFRAKTRTSILNCYSKVISEVFLFLAMSQHSSPFIPRMWKRLLNYIRNELNWGRFETQKRRVKSSFSTWYNLCIFKEISCFPELKSSYLTEY